MAKRKVKLSDSKIGFYLKKRGRINKTTLRRKARIPLPKEQKKAVENLVKKLSQKEAKTLWEIMSSVESTREHTNIASRKKVDAIFQRRAKTHGVDRNMLEFAVQIKIGQEKSGQVDLKIPKSKAEKDAMIAKILKEFNP